MSREENLKALGADGRVVLRLLEVMSDEQIRAALLDGEHRNETLRKENTAMRQRLEVIAR